MNVKIALICLIGIPGMLGASATGTLSTRKIEDPIAYRTGEKTAELVLEQWIQLAKKNINKVIELSSQVASVGKDYSQKVNKSFLQGNIDCLKKKNIKALAEKQKLDKHGCARVLAYYYAWDSIITAGMASGVFDVENTSEVENEALERAVREVYGAASPKLVAELKKSIDGDDEIADFSELIDIDEEDDEDDDSDEDSIDE